MTNCVEYGGVCSMCKDTIRNYMSIDLLREESEDSSSTLREKGKARFLSPLRCLCTNLVRQHLPCLAMCCRSGTCQCSLASCDMPTLEGTFNGRICTRQILKTPE